MVYTIQKIEFINDGIRLLEEHFFVNSYEEGCSKIREIAKKDMLKAEQILISKHKQIWKLNEKYGFIFWL